MAQEPSCSAASPRRTQDTTSGWRPGGANHWHAMVEQSRIRRDVMRSILQEPMLTPGDAAVALGGYETNSGTVRRYRDQSWLVGVPYGGGYLYPAFQFDDVFPEVLTVNARLGASSDPWGVASWWLSTHDALRDRPADLVGTDRAADLLDAAAAVLEPIG